MTPADQMTALEPGPWKADEPPRGAFRENSFTKHAFAKEEARIRGAYARRRQTSVYSMADPAHRMACEERERKLLAALAQHGFSSLEHAKILDVGCGAGSWLRDFLRWGARPENLAGVDLLPERIAEARRLSPEINLRCGSATRLEAPDGTFDLVLQSTVFTSILDFEMKRQIAREMMRVLKPPGCIVWYDFFRNNPRNRDVRGVSRAEIVQLFPGCEISLQRLTLAPPLGRPLARFSPALCRLLSHLKPLCSHYLGIITPA